MDLDPGIRTFIDEVDAAYEGAPAFATVAQQRDSYEAFSRNYLRPYPPGLTVEDLRVPGDHHSIPIRIYRPRQDRSLPAVLYFHGGGFILGSIATHDTITAGLAAETGSAVVSVDYRLAPEFPFPAAFEDAWGALRYVVSRGTALAIDPGRIVVAGDSAGGNLAAAIALAARDSGGPQLRGQALIYPALGLDFELPSFGENAHAPMLTRASTAQYWKVYLNGNFEGATPYAAPLLAGDLRGLSPAFIGTAQYDPVRDDGEIYAEKLRSAGVPVELRRAPRLVHGWLRARFMSADAGIEFDALCAAVKRFLGIA
jgi:acetyl esterase